MEDEDKVVEELYVGKGKGATLLQMLEYHVSRPQNEYFVKKKIEIFDVDTICKVSISRAKSGVFRFKFRVQGLNSGLNTGAMLGSTQNLRTASHIIFFFSSSQLEKRI